MNNICYAGRRRQTGTSPNKNFEIIVPDPACTISAQKGNFALDPGQAAVIPPLTEYSVSGTAIFVALEHSLLSFKEVKIIPDDDAGGIAFAAAQALSYYSRSCGGRESLLAALGGLIAAYVAAFGGECGLSPVVITVKAEIENSVSLPYFSLEDSIKKLPLNYDYVRKLFKKEVGVTPHEYLLNCRMKLAKEFISSGIGNKYSNYSVGQIAEACGFAEPLYFSRVFKKYYGLSPSAAARAWTAAKAIKK